MDPITNSSVNHFNNENGIDFTQSLPPEVCLKIFAYLSSIELTRSSMANKACQILASDEALWKSLPLPEMAFGKAAWEKYFGDVGEEPPLPIDIHKILKSPCPFWPDKKVEETHMLVLVPETVNGEPLNLTTLGKLVKTPKEGHSTHYRYIWDKIINEHGKATVKSQWVLMTKDVIEGSRKKNYTNQQAIIAEFAKKTGIAYEVPNTLDAAVCLFTEFVRSEKRLFNDKPWTYTRCQEKAEGYPVVVGGFSPAGLFVYCDSGSWP